MELSLPALVVVKVTQDPGVYVSTDDGTNWQDITPDDFPTTHYRSEIGVAPSFEDLFYLLADTGGGASGLSFYLFVTSDLNYVSAINRSENIPNFGGSVGDLNPQGGYNLVCVVSPETIISFSLEVLIYSDQKMGLEVQLIPVTTRYLGWWLCLCQ